jgi:hypothetical protein
MPQIAAKTGGRRVIESSQSIEVQPTQRLPDEDTGIKVAPCAFRGRPHSFHGRWSTKMHIKVNPSESGKLVAVITTGAAGCRIHNAICRESCSGGIRA